MERRLTKAFMIAFFPLLLAARPARTSGTEKGKFEPYVFGVTRGNVGCVILKQHTAIKKKWLAAGVLAGVGEFKVVQTFHYQIKETKFQGREGSQELGRIAREDRVKFVVIPSDYTPDQLKTASDQCQKNSLTHPRFLAPPSQTLAGSGGEVPSAPDVTLPEAVYQPGPAYTPEARKAGIEGPIELWISIDDHGNVTDARVVKGLGYGLDEEAVKIAKTWKFKPATQGNKPVPLSLMAVVSFRLNE